MNAFPDYNAPKRRKFGWYAAAFPIWICAVIAGFYYLTAYANRPGQTGLSPALWPARSRVARNPHHATLVMFMHPKCPCSRATVGELAELMTHYGNQIDATVFFVKPAGAAPDWTSTDNWREAARIPGVKVKIDELGAEAQLFHAATSGDILLYTSDGRLAFHGGITGSRGHFGDNDGLDALESAVQTSPASLKTFPVYGCSLFGCATNQIP